MICPQESNASEGFHPSIYHTVPQKASLSKKSDPKKAFSKMGNTKGLLAKRATGSRRQVWWWKRRVWLPAGKSCIIGLIVVLFTFILFFPIITYLSQSKWEGSLSLMYQCDEPSRINTGMLVNMGVLRKLPVFLWFRPYNCLSNRFLMRTFS